MEIVASVDVNVLPVSRNLCVLCGNPGGNSFLLPGDLSALSAQKSKIVELLHVKFQVQTKRYT